MIGDISALGWSAQVLAEASVWSVVFFEVIGLQKDRMVEALTSAKKWCHYQPKDSRSIRGMSPHAPYSVRRTLFERVAELSAEWPFPVAVHLAETLDESQLMKEQSGPLVPFLEELGAWDPDGVVESAEQVIEIFSPTPNALMVHGNYLNPATPIATGQSIVYCPRTHAEFGHSPHPFREFLARGVRVALGTDSLASNPDLNMLAEARFVHQRCPNLPGDVLLRMATRFGADALGFGHITGSLVPGKSADLIVIPVEERKVVDPHDLIWESNTPVKSVMWRGQWISI
jgi:cytosine/adenosine deaminase-related metal-dependent hydrolase